MANETTFSHPSGTATLYHLKDAIGTPPRLAWLHPSEKPVRVGKAEYELPGADGLVQMRLGLRDQRFTLEVVAVGTSETHVEDLVRPIVNAQDGRTGTLSLRGGITTVKHCELESAEFDEHKVAWGGLTLLYGMLTFRKLAPDQPGAVTGGASTWRSGTA